MKRYPTKVPGIFYRVDAQGLRRYIVRWEDSRGKDRSETLPLGSTLEDAKAHQALLRQRKASGHLMVPTKRTVGDLLDEYMAGRKDLAPKTLEVYELGVKYVKDEIGHLKVSKITPQVVFEFRSTLQEKGLKTWSVKKYETPLKGALVWAVREGWIPRNPYADPLPHERLKDDTEEKRCLSTDEIKLLLKPSSSSSERWRTLFTLLVLSGLRISEALTLTWDDIDFSASLIHVRKGKTKSAERSVMMTSGLADMLQEWKQNRSRSFLRLVNGQDAQNHSPHPNGAISEDSATSTESSDGPNLNEDQTATGSSTALGTSKSGRTASGKQSTESSWPRCSEEPSSQESPSITRTESETTTGLRILNSGSGPSGAGKGRLTSSAHTAEKATSDLVFATGSGAPISRRNALRALRAAEKKAGLPNYTLHELRHTFASILIDQRETLTLISEQLGHKDPQVTLKVYAHFFEKASRLDEARERLQAAFGGMV